MPEVRTSSLGTSLAVGAVVLLATGCSDEDPTAGATLPPIQTTTTSATTIPPTTTQPRFYEIQPGDTLTEIAAAYGLPILAIMEMNGIADQNTIFAGQILELPVAAEIVATSLPPAPAGAPPGTTVAP